MAQWFIAFILALSLAQKVREQRCWIFICEEINLSFKNMGNTGNSFAITVLSNNSKIKFVNTEKLASELTRNSNHHENIFKAKIDVE